MRIIDHLKRATFEPETRWIVKYNKIGKVIEIKQLYDPENYKKINKHKREILKKEQLINILENDRKK